MSCDGVGPKVKKLETSTTWPTDISTAYLPALPWRQPFSALDPDQR